MSTTSVDQVNEDTSNQTLPVVGTVTESESKNSLFGDFITEYLRIKKEKEINFESEKRLNDKNEGVVTLEISDKLIAIGVDESCGSGVITHASRSNFNSLAKLVPKQYLQRVLVCLMRGTGHSRGSELAIDFFKAHEASSFGHPVAIIKCSLENGLKENTFWINHESFFPTYQDRFYYLDIIQKNVRISDLAISYRVFYRILSSCTGLEEIITYLQKNKEQVDWLWKLCFLILKPELKGSDLLKEFVQIARTLNFAPIPDELNNDEGKKRVREITSNLQWLCRRFPEVNDAITKLG